MKRFAILGAALLGCALAMTTPAQAKGTGELTTLNAGPYLSDTNNTLTGPYQAGKLLVGQTYRNTSSTLQDSLAFTVQAFGPNYSQALQTAFFGPTKAVGPHGGQDTYQLGEIELPGPGSYLVSTAVFVYDRAAKDWISGPTKVYWLFPTNPPPLPVTLVSFTATVATDSTTLKWSTASEENSFGFFVERSTDGLSWSTQSFTASQGALTWAKPHSYQVRDVLPRVRTYYRLRQVDVGSKAQHYSPVVTVAPARPVATVYPNPARDAAHVPGAAGHVAKLYNYSGQLNREQLLDDTEVLDLHGLAAGTYLLVVGDKRTRLATY